MIAKASVRLDGAANKQPEQKEAEQKEAVQKWLLAAQSVNNKELCQLKITSAGCPAFPYTPQPITLSNTAAARTKAGTEVISTACPHIPLVVYTNVPSHWRDHGVDCGGPESPGVAVYAGLDAIA